MHGARKAATSKVGEAVPGSSGRVQCLRRASQSSLYPPWRGSSTVPPPYMALAGVLVCACSSARACACPAVRAHARLPTSLHLHLHLHKGKRRQSKKESARRGRTGRVQIHCGAPCDTTICTNNIKGKQAQPSLLSLPFILFVLPAIAVSILAVSWHVIKEFSCDPTGQIPSQAHNVGHGSARRAMVGLGARGR